MTTVAVDDTNVKVYESWFDLRDHCGIIPCWKVLDMGKVIGPNAKGQSFVSYILGWGERKDAPCSKECQLILENIGRGMFTVSFGPKIESVTPANMLFTWPTPSGDMGMRALAAIDSGAADLYNAHRLGMA